MSIGKSALSVAVAALALAGCSSGAGNNLGGATKTVTADTTVTAITTVTATAPATVHTANSSSETTATETPPKERTVSDLADIGVQASASAVAGLGHQYCHLLDVNGSRFLVKNLKKDGGMAAHHDVLRIIIRNYCPTYLSGLNAAYAHQTHKHKPTQQPANRPAQVTYKITGTAKSASITYQTTSGTAQRTVSLPYTINLHGFSSADPLHITAQKVSSRGTVTCRIKRRGNVISRNTTSGANTTIARCRS